MNPEKLFTAGLQAVFAGVGQREEVERGGFKLTATHYVGPGGEIYHDEWSEGGGHERIRTADGDLMIRTYVGNTIVVDKLTPMGIHVELIMLFLKEVISTHGQETRLYDNFELEVKDWRYVYTVTRRREDPFIITSDEEIYFKGKLVFVHTFGISEVVEQ